MQTLEYKESIFERAMRQTQNPRKVINSYETRGHKETKTNRQK